MKTAAKAFLILAPVAMLAYIVAFVTVNVPYLEDTRCILGQLVAPFPDRIYHLFDLNNEHRLVTTRLAAEFANLAFGRIDFRIMCALGSMALLSWVLLLCRQFICRAGIVFCSSFMFMAFSFVHFENQCWALAGLSNYQALLWGMCANLISA